ncbi:Uncharacterised protein [uncultured archaeon]|nr:Uncharacterised protein [uncultured archaeon]
MPAAASHGVEVIEADAWLRNRERVCGRRNKPGCYEGLEICNRSDSEVDIITPACDHRVPFHPCMPVLLEKRQIRFTH